MHHPGSALMFLPIVMGMHSSLLRPWLCSACFACSSGWLHQQGPWQAMSVQSAYPEGSLRCSLGRDGLGPGLPIQPHVSGPLLLLCKSQDLGFMQAGSNHTAQQTLFTMITKFQQCSAEPNRCLLHLLHKNAKGR